MRRGAFRIFSRTWWRPNVNWPQGLEPHAGRKHTIGFADTEEAARDMCRVYAANHKPGRLSRKAEYESQ
jgi:hypothetical protein